MKIIMMLVLVCVVSLNTVHAENEASWFVKTSVMSKYLGSIGSVFNDAPITVNEAGVIVDEWTFGLYTATGLQGESYGTTYADEIDAYIVWTRSFDWVRVEVSSSYYALAQLDLMSDDMWVIESEASFIEIPFVEPYVRIRYFGEIGSDSPRGGMFYHGGIRKSFTLGQMANDRSYLLHTSISTAYAGGAFHDPMGFTHARFTTIVDIPIGESVTFSPIVMLQLGAQKNHPSNFGDDEIVFGGSLKFVW